MCFVSTYSIVLPYRAQRYSGLSLQIHQSQRCGAKDNERLFVVLPHQFFLLVELDGVGCGGGCGGGCGNGGGGMITQSTKPYRIMPNDADKNHHICTSNTVQLTMSPVSYDCEKKTRNAGVRV
ncbi:unnamed protein product [Pylaiella littoralis]